MRFVVDARVLLRIADGAVEAHPANELVGPAALRSHVSAILLDEVRAGSLERRIAVKRLDALAGIKVRLLNDRVSRRVAFDLAEEHGWDLVEAEYVAVCKLQADALVTLDTAFAKRAGREVALAPVEAVARGT
jgi:predicted nucleic acid-binding protein